jgi:hypothetical protein
MAENKILHAKAQRRTESSQPQEDTLRRKPRSRLRIVKRWRRIALVLLGLVVLSQLPFAYRHYRLGRLHNAIQQLASQRIDPTDETGFTDYKGVIHVHSFLGGHSTGTFSEIINAAKLNDLDFVVMTEHPEDDFDTAEMTLKGLHGGTLFINGNEVVTANGDRLLLIPGNDAASLADARSTQQVIDRQKAMGGFTFITYPEQFKSWQVSGFDGIEVYNLFSNILRIKRINRPVILLDGLWSYRDYRELVFANFFERPSESLKRWDDAALASDRRLVGTAGNDAHSNIGLSLNDPSGKLFVGFKVDPYERSFRMVRNHVLIERGKPLTRESLLDALSRGHCYMSFDLFGDPTGFSYWAENGTEKRITGDEIKLEGGARLRISTPLKSRIVLVRDGSVIQEQDGVMQSEFTATQAGNYRVEVFLSQLPGRVSQQPWIISNPIYVR